MAPITPSTRTTTYNPVTPTTAFPVNFPIADNSDLKVTVNGAVRTDFTVASTYPDGLSYDAVVNMNTAVTGAVIIYGKRIPRRQNQFQTGRPLPIPDLNASLNTLEIESQEARRDIDQNTADIAQEIIDRSNAVAQVQANLNAETSARVAGDNALNSALVTEASIRATADTALASLIAQGGPIEVPFYDTQLAASFSFIKGTIQKIRTGGYSQPADGGGADQRRVPAKPLHDACFRSMDRYLPNGTIDAVNGGWWILDAVESARLQMVGGADDNVTDNRAAVSALIARYPDGVTLDLPEIVSGTYIFAGPVDFGNLMLNPLTDGISLSLLSYLGDDVKMMRPLRLYYPNGIYSDQAGRYKKPTVDKSLWLSPGDYDETRYIGIDATVDLAHMRWAWPEGGDWASVGSPPATQADQVTWSLTNDGYFYGSFVPAVPGDELCCSWPSTLNFLRAAIIQCVGGDIIIYAEQDGTVTMISKPKSGGAATAVLTWLGKVNHLTYSMVFAECGIRVMSQSSWNLSVSGMPIFATPQSSLGDILRIGFGGYTSIAGPVSTPVYGWTLKRGGWTGNNQSFSLGISGDSKSAAHYGAWSYFVREALDYHRGLRCTGVDNRAVDGDTSAQQLARLQSIGLGSTRFWLIDLGTNDWQQLVAIGAIGTAGTYIDNLYQITNFIRTNGGIVVGFVEPMQMYDQGAVVAVGGPPGHGQVTANYEKGAAYRLAARRLCQSLNIPFISSQDFSGPVVANFLLGDQAFVDPAVKDNIHPTIALNRVRGYYIAKRVADVLAPKPSKTIARQILSSVFYKNSWSGAVVGEEPWLYRDDRGIVWFDGKLGNGANGTVMVSLPTYLCPARKMSFVGLASTGACQLDVATSGDITVNGAAGATWVSLAGLSWRTGWKD